MPAMSVYDEQLWQDKRCIYLGIIEHYKVFFFQDLSDSYFVYKYASSLKTVFVQSISILPKKGAEFFERYAPDKAWLFTLSILKAVQSGLVFR